LAAGAIGADNFSSAAVEATVAAAQRFTKLIVVSSITDDTEAVKFNRYGIAFP
jgi:hypothetical protein